MKGRILFVAGVGVGYVLGTRAGRERYEQLKTAASRLWNDPRVQRQVDQAEQFVKDKAPDVAEFALDGAKKVVSTVRGASSTTKKPVTRRTSSTSKPSTSKTD